MGPHNSGAVARGGLRTGMLPVTGGHVLAWHDQGREDQPVALVLHGGPGSAFSSALTRWFEPDRWRIVGFDQRGCGRSTPRGATRQNDTAALLQDIESLRHALGIPEWVVVGGSWGATLALAYAAAFPCAVRGLLLRNLFVPEAAELRWFFRDAQVVAPAAWERLASLAPESCRDDLLPWLTAVFAAGSPAIQERVTLAWLQWESTLSGAEHVPPCTDVEAAVDRFRVQTHYLAHGCWLSGGVLVRAARRLPCVPVRFLHGEQDQVCRFQAARAIQEHAQGSRFDLVPGAGHDPLHHAMDAAMRDALRTVTR